jgi:hypothetical protein
VPILRKIDSLARTIALLFVTQFLVMQFLVRHWQQLSFEEYFWIGNDFSFLYSGAGFFLSGNSPYSEPNFIPLPPALYLPMALHHFSFWGAFTAFRTITFLLVLAALLWLCRQLQVHLVNTALILVIALTYGPFYTLLAGGNLDGLMLAMLVFGCTGSERLRGALLGLSIGTKLYSLVLIPVLALRRRWLEIGWAVGTLVLLLLPFLRYWPDALSTAFHRTSVLRLGGNESPAVLFILLFGEHRAWAWKICYVLLWGGTLLARMARDVRNGSDPDYERFSTLAYLPWMAAAPVLVFSYTGTILLPVVVCLVRKNQSRSLHWAEWVSVAGFLLTGVYPALYMPLLHLLAKLTSLQIEHFSRVIAPIGIAAMLVGGSLASWKAPNGERAAVATAVR